MRPGLLWLFVLALPACDEPKPSKATATVAAKSVPTAAPKVSAALAPSASAPAAGVAATASATSSAAASDAPDDTPELEMCRVGLSQLPMTGPAAIVRGESGLRVVFNDQGAPRAVTPNPAPAAGTRAHLSETATKSTSPACALAAGKWFCADATGALHRRADQPAGRPATVDGATDDKVIAKGRPGAPMTAVSVGGRAAYAFLGDRKTTEGAVTLAFIAVDDATPVLLSEEGSGATHVSLVALEGHAVAAYIDARRAMTPVHARDVTIDATGALKLGKDAVSFVAEGSDGRTACALIAGAGTVMGLVPIGDGSGFGMAAVKLGSPPIDEAPTLWSKYPNGCTPAPIAATPELPATVARVRPAGRAPGSRRVLELGDVAADGAFSSRCAIARQKFFSDVAIAGDGKGQLWVTFTDGDGTWLARLEPASADEKRGPKRVGH